MNGQRLKDPISPIIIIIINLLSCEEVFCECCRGLHLRRSVS